MSIIVAAVAWLMTYLLHSTVLIAGALALAGLGVVRSAAARDTLWKVALIGGVVTATAQVALRLHPWAGHVAIASRPLSPFVDIAGVRELPMPPAPPSDPEYPAASRFAGAVTGAPAAGELPEPPTRTVVSFFQNLHIGWPAMLLNLWFIGALGFGSRLVFTRWMLSRRLRGRRVIASGPLRDMMLDLAATAGVRAPALSVSSALSGPIAFGDEIILPERVLTCLAPSEQRAVIAHELGHVVRRDPAWLMGALAIESLLFVQPLNQLMRRRLRAASEYLCDDWAAERAGGIVLARCLAEVAGWVQQRPAPAAVAGMAGHCSQLVSRVERLLENGVPARPGRWALRAAAGAMALGLVAWSVPGVAAEDLDGGFAAAEDASNDAQWGTVPVRLEQAAEGDTWGRLTDDGRTIVLASGYTVKIRGQGELGFRQWGRIIAVPDGYDVRVDGRPVSENQELCTSRTLRLVETDGNGAWELIPVRQPGARSYADDERARTAAVAARRDAQRDLERELASLDMNTQQLTRAGMRLAGLSVQAAGKELEHDADTDAALDGQADAAIDTLVQLWVRDPESVRRAARRIARTYDRELRPQFESLGVEMGRQLAPQLQRLTDRVGRDLSPEFARLGAELGASIIGSLVEPPPAPGAGDRQGKRQPKDRQY